jgi:hypothetical protein
MICQRELGMLSEAHKLTLQLKYGLPDALVRSLEESGVVSSLSPSEVRNHLGRVDIDSSGFLLKYPGNGASTIRLDAPLIRMGKPQKYLRRYGEPNCLFIPPGVDLKAQELWIVEGELKALCGHAHGLQIVALPGIWNWRTESVLTELLPEYKGKQPDADALLPALAQIDWKGKKVCLLYDSDIVPGHAAYDAFPRLAEQLYRLGCLEVQIISLPPVLEEGKTGLDDFFLAKKDQALSGLQTIRNKTEPYLPIRDGAVAYAERLIGSESSDDRIKAAIAYYATKGEFATTTWLKEHKIKPLKPLLQEAKIKSKMLQAGIRTISRSTNISGLGSEYEYVKELLKPHLKEFDLDGSGRLGKLVVQQNMKGELEFVVVPLCNFVAWPTRDILKDNGAATDRHIEFEGLLQGTPLRRVQVSAKDFLEMKWAIPAWGAKAAIKPKAEQQIRYALQLMAESGIPETTVYTHLGWRNVDGRWYYLHAKGAVGIEDAGLEVEITERLKRYILPAGKGADIRASIKTSLALLKLGPAKLMYPMYAGVWLAPLCEPLRTAGIEPSYTLYIWGESGTFKSTIIALYLCHYGNFNRATLPASFKDTKLSIPEMCFICKDIIFGIDDLYPTKDLREWMKMEGNMEHVVRTQGDRQGRGKLTSLSELKEGHPPRGLVYITGEYLSLLGSSLPRTMHLHILKDDIDEAKMSEAQKPENQAHLAEAMVGYLEHLAPQLDDLAPKFFKDFEQLRKKAGEGKDRHERYNETTAFLYLGFNCFINYAVAEGAITEEESAEYLQKAWQILNEVADDLAQVAKSVAPTKRFFEALNELTLQGRVYFADMTGKAPEEKILVPGAVHVGWGPNENGTYFLLWGTAWEQVTRYLRNQDEGLSLSKDAFLDSLEQQGLLDKSDETQKDRRVIQIRIEKTKVRALPVLKAAFDIDDTEEVEDGK